MDYPKSVPGVGLVGGKFIDENVQTGQQGSLIPAAWGNAVSDEILSVITGAGLTPDESAYDQLLEAIETLIASGAVTYENSAAVLQEDGVASAGARNTAARGDHRHPTDTSRAPVGSVQYFALPSAPAGWLKANGAAVSRTTYAALFVAIGTSFGAGNGSTTFNLPDLRGEFIRGVDDGRGVDAGRALGSWQADASQKITGTLGGAVQYRAGALPATGAFNNGSGGYNGNDNAGSDPSRYVDFDSSRVVRTADETRPRNVALLPCIKY